MKIIKKIRQAFIQMRLQPIRVFCFHQVSEVYDEASMVRCDWISTDDLKKNITELLQEGYIFISLPEVHEKLKRDRFRCKKYAALTSDDGCASVKNILPWLNEEKIPITLFLNPAYLDGKHYRDKDTELYLAEDEIRHLHEQYPLLTIGMHGWEHKDASKQTEEEFRESVAQSEKYLNQLPNFIPYFAYAWGRRTEQTNAILINKGIVPVTVRGFMNYDNSRIIDREVIESKK